MTRQKIFIICIDNRHTRILNIMKSGQEQTNVSFIVIKLYN